MRQRRGVFAKPSTPSIPLKAPRPRPLRPHVNGSTIEALGAADPASRQSFRSPRWRRTKPVGGAPGVSSRAVGSQKEARGPATGEARRRIAAWAGSAPGSSWVGGLLAGALLGALLVSFVPGPPAPSGTACRGAEACRVELQGARQQLAACLVFCGGEEQRLQRARVRYREEREAALLRRHYEERRRIEQRQRAERERHDAAEVERLRQAQARAAEADHRHQLELERLRARQLDARRARQRERSVAMYRLLGPAGRSLRLRQCLIHQADCDALLGLLLQAATDEREVGALKALLVRELERDLAPPQAAEVPSPALAEPSGASPSQVVPTASPPTGPSAEPAARAPERQPAAGASAPG